MLTLSLRSIHLERAALIVGRLILWIGGRAADGSGIGIRSPSMINVLSRL